MAQLRRHIYSCSIEVVLWSLGEEEDQFIVTRRAVPRRLRYGIVFPPLFFQIRQGLRPYHHTAANPLRYVLPLMKLRNSGSAMAK